MRQLWTAVPDAAAAWLERIARERDRSVSWVVRQAIALYIAAEASEDEDVFAGLSVGDDEEEEDGEDEDG